MQQALTAVMAAAAVLLALSAFGTSYGQSAPECGADEYLHYNQCVAQCPEGWDGVETTGQDQCVAQCADGQSTALVAYENSDKVEYHCLDSCDRYSLEEGIGTNMCQGYGLFKIYEFEGREINALHTRTSGCPDSLPNWDGKSCVASCPSGMPYVNDGTCVASCPAGTLQALDNTCVASCPVGTLEVDDGTCQESCPLDAPNRDRGQCLAECPAERSEVVDGLCTRPAPATGTDNQCYFRPGYGYATPEQQGLELDRYSGTIYVGAGMYGQADAGLLSGASMGDYQMSISLSDNTENRYDRYIVNICNMHTGEWGSIGRISSASEPVIFDMHGSVQETDSSAVRYITALTYDPANTYWIYVVGVAGNNIWLSPYQEVSFGKSFEIVGDDPGDDSPQKSYSQSVPALQDGAGPSGQSEPPRLPSQSQQQQQQDNPGPSEDSEPHDSVDSGQDAPPPTPDNEAKIRDLEERIQRLDYRIGVAQDLLDQTKPHQEKRIEKLNEMIDKLTERKAMLQERLDNLS